MLLSKNAYVDNDDWIVSFRIFNVLDRMWGSFTVDRFATGFSSCVSDSTQICGYQVVVVVVVIVDIIILIL